MPCTWKPQWIERPSATVPLAVMPSAHVCLHRRQLLRTSRDSSGCRMAGWQLCSASRSLPFFGTTTLPGIKGVRMHDTQAKRQLGLTMACDYLATIVLPLLPWVGRNTTAASAVHRFRNYCLCIFIRLIILATFWYTLLYQSNFHAEFHALRHFCTFLHVVF